MKTVVFNFHLKKSVNSQSAKAHKTIYTAAPVASEPVDNFED